MRTTAFLIVGMIVLAIFVGAKLTTTHKDTVAGLVMPGKLTNAHAKFESQCAKCHADFKKENQRELCFSCHENIRTDINTIKGYHGRLENIVERECSQCHTEHKGRGFDMVHLDKETFKHDLTDFPLKGAHARLSVRCESCHLPEKKFYEAPSDCFSCHSKDDRHKGALGTNCSDCHTINSWKDTYFDHGKTKFPLTGKHQKVSCDACHSNQSYKNTPVTCAACHMINDVHDSPKDERCERCHNTESWKKISYDHAKETKFTLTGRHTELACNSCHTQNVFKTKLGMDCNDCHKADDVHKGKNSTNCAQCHSTTDWKKVLFDHDRDTKFKLIGCHKRARCEQCHQSNSKDMKIDSTCYSCHKSEDVHKGQEGPKCDSCHNVDNWKEKIKFDHDLTRFPLIGLHATTSCSECHLSSAFKDVKMDCVACHTKDDFHKKTLGTDCARCHNPNSWKLWEFDHNIQCDYKLEGSHAGLKCIACHKQPMDKKVIVDTQCASCHDDDDVHHGRFSTSCEQCHNVNSWKDITIGKSK